MSAADAARLAGIGRLARIVAALSLAVVVVSAWLRLDAAGLGCADWPTCYGAVLAGAKVDPGFARVLHRIVATSALLLALLLAWRAWRPHPLPRVVVPASALVGVMLLLSLLGIWSADPRRVVVSLLNILGGLALVSLSWRLVLAASAPAAPHAQSPLLRAGLAALTATVLLGALIGARYAAASCTSMPFCGDIALPRTLAALSPFDLVDAPARPGDAGGASLHLLHRYAALAALALVGAAAVRRIGTGGAAWAVLALLASTALLGIATVAGGFPLVPAIAHGAAAAALLAACVSFARR